MYTNSNSCAGSDSPATHVGQPILIVDDETPIRRFLRISLASHDYPIIEATTGQEAINAVVTQQPALLILDLGLPDLDGVEVTRLLREWTQIPIIILSVRSQEGDKIAALDAGADDYLTKPFGTGELLARIRVALRRADHGAAEPRFATEDLQADWSRRLVTMRGRVVPLTPTEYDLLRILATHAGRVLTHHQLLRKIWGTDHDAERHILRVNISNLRRKLEPDPSRPRYIITEPGVGYRLRIA